MSDVSEKGFFEICADHAQCPVCGSMRIRWAEAGNVPGWRRCERCGEEGDAEKFLSAAGKDILAVRRRLRLEKKEVKMRGVRIIEQAMMVISAGTRLVGCMPWETPYVKFRDLNSQGEYLWTSENASVASMALRAGDQVYVDAYAYPVAGQTYLSLRRVRILRSGDPVIYGGSKQAM